MRIFVDDDYLVLDKELWSEEVGIWSEESSGMFSDLCSFSKKYAKCIP